MLCSDAGLTAFAADMAEQDVLTETADEAVQEETQAQEEESEEKSGEESEKEYVKTEAEAKTEETPPQDGQKEDTTPEETPSEEGTGEAPDSVDDETGAAQETPVEEAAPESDADAEQNLQTDESVSALAVSGGDISGTYEKITWSITAKGNNLIVNGTGDFNSDPDEPAPWAEYADKVIYAVINVTGMTHTSRMFENCSKLTGVNWQQSDTSDVTDMHNMFYGCTEMDSLDLSNFNTGIVTNMRKDAAS